MKSSATKLQGVAWPSGRSPCQVPLVVLAGQNGFGGGRPGGWERVWRGRAERVEELLLPRPLERELPGHEQLAALVQVVACSQHLVVEQRLGAGAAAAL